MVKNAEVTGNVTNITNVTNVTNDVTNNGTNDITNNYEIGTNKDKVGTNNGTNNSAIGTMRNNSGTIAEQSGTISGTMRNDSGTISGTMRNDAERYEEIEKLILDRMRADRRVSVKQLSKTFGKSKTSMFRIIDKLKADGKIRRLGSEKSGTWEVIE